MQVRWMAGVLSAALGMAVMVVPVNLRAADSPATASASAPASKPSVGSTAKDFTLKTLEDREVQLTALLKDGPVVVLMLRGWVGYQCPICNQQVGEFISNAKALTATGARVVMVYPGPEDTVKAKAKEFITGKTLPENFYFLIDPSLKTIVDYGIRWSAPNENSYPSTFVIDKEGKFQFVKISNSHGGRATAKEVLAVLEKK